MTARAAPGDAAAMQETSSARGRCAGPLEPSGIPRTTRAGAARFAALGRVLAFVLPASFAGPAAGNAGPVQQGADPGGLAAPTTTSQVRIDRETLTLDFTGDPATCRVHAAYELTNVSGDAASLDLVFVAPYAGELSIRRDGAAVATTPDPAVRLPTDWTAGTEGLDPRTGKTYELLDAGSSRLWGFRLDVPVGGRCRLEADYVTHLGYDRGQADFVIRHFVYVLGPARYWAGFGTLEVTARVPAEYAVATLPALERRGVRDGVVTWGGSFTGVPADVLRISKMRRPDAWTDNAALLAVVPPVLLAIVAAVLIPWLLSRRLRPGATAALSAVAALTATLAGGMAWVDFVQPVLGELSHGTGIFYGAVAAEALGASLSTVAAAIVGYRWSKRRRRAQ
ncbi:MAG: hypothetical protein HY905_15415 [Deltaproteobacteria bacterium]|nr:hypothetical protein [Deltaproteobacteria bacterium]